MSITNETEHPGSSSPVAETQRQEEPPWTAADEAWAKQLLGEGIERLVMGGLEHRYYVSNRTLYGNMQHRLGKCRTAEASRTSNGGKVIEWGRQFLKQVNALALDVGENPAEFVADGDFHELGHHAWLHMFPEARAVEEGYNSNVVNIAEDAIINAMNHKAGRTRLMQHFYPDKGAAAFLRPNSKSPNEFKEEEGVERPRDRDGKIIPTQAEFYRRLYACDITLEESLAFVQHYFADDNTQPMGSHNDDSQGEPQDNAEGGEEGQGQSRPGEQEGSGNRGQVRQGQSGEESGSALDRGEAQAFLRALGIELPSAEAQNNFRDIIAKIITLSTQTGQIRSDNEFTRRMPARIKRRDLIRTERPRIIFTRNVYGKKDFAIFLDVSGSVDAYAPFFIGLVKGLNEADRPAATYVWADEVAEIDLENCKDAEVGTGTQGEKVAAEIEKKGYRTVVILTDNRAGKIITPIKAQVYLCLVEGATETDSFNDPSVVPHCKVFQLKLKTLR